MKLKGLRYCVKDVQEFIKMANKERDTQWVEMIDKLQNKQLECLKETKNMTDDDKDLAKSEVYWFIEELKESMEKK